MTASEVFGFSFIACLGWKIMELIWAIFLGTVSGWMGWEHEDEEDG